MSETPIGETVIMLRVMAEGCNGGDYQTCVDAAYYLERLERELTEARRELEDTRTTMLGAQASLGLMRKQRDEAQRHIAQISITHPHLAPAMSKKLK